MPGFKTNPCRPSAKAFADFQRVQNQQGEENLVHYGSKPAMYNFASAVGVLASIIKKTVMLTRRNAHTKAQASLKL